jgi:hypothetical protein
MWLKLIRHVACDDFLPANLPPAFSLQVPVADLINQANRTMTACLALLVLVATLALSAGFLATPARMHMRFTHAQKAMQMQTDEQSDKSPPTPLKWETALCSAMIALSMSQDVMALNKPPVQITVRQLEESIDKLEQSGSRSETVQTMADLFDATGSKTLLSRTKYKYVRMLCAVLYVLFCMLYRVCCVVYAASDGWCPVVLLFHCSRFSLTLLPHVYPCVPLPTLQTLYLLVLRALPYALRPTMLAAHHQGHQRQEGQAGKRVGRGAAVSCTVCCPLSPVPPPYHMHHAQCTMHHALCTIHYTLYTLHYTLYTNTPLSHYHSILHTAYCCILLHTVCIRPAYCLHTACTLPAHSLSLSLALALALPSPSTPAQIRER